MIEVTKKDKETSASLARRFTKKVKQSSVLNIVKSLRFRKRPVSALRQKQDALKRIKKEERISLLKKLGKITEQRPNTHPSH